MSDTSGLFVRGGGRGSQSHIAGLDFLRTFAIVGVTLFHLFPKTIEGGYLGVSLFFVLTGYLLAYTSERARHAGRFSVLRYYGKRLLRIYPLLLIVLLTTVGAYHFLAPDAIEAIRPEALAVLLGYDNWWQIAQQADYFARMAEGSPFTHLWFLGIEMQFYLVFPLLYRLFVLMEAIVGRRAGIALIAVLGLASAAVMPLLYQSGADITRVYFGTDTRVYALLLGMALGLVRAGGRKQPGTGEYALLAGIDLALLFALAIAAYILLRGESPIVYEGGMALMTLIFLVIVGITGSGDLGIGTFFENPFFRWVGKKSYAIFLWQYPVIYLFAIKGWEKDFGLFTTAIEMAIILVLSVWSDAADDCLTKFRLPSARYFFFKRIVFSLATVAGLIFLVYGTMGLALSKDVKADQVQLKQEMEQNAKKLAEKRDADASASAAQKEKERQAAETARQRGEASLTGVACIGDSVMLGSADALSAALPGAYIDAEVSRYVGGGLEAAQTMNACGELGKVVVIALGTNGPIAGSPRYEEQTVALLDYLSQDRSRHIFWVNVYCPKLKWQDTNNAYIAHIPEGYPNVTVVDWYSLVSQHPEWLVSDGVHPNKDGQAAYAKLVRDTIVQTMGRAK